MKIPAQADLQRWSEEVARDPASLAFLPLARAYRRQGQRDAARQLCLRGLEHYPTHVEAHSLLALLYLEDGERVKAADEWSMVLRMDPNHFEALRGIGFCYLEQDQLSRARQALEKAALLRPQDAAVQEALKVLGTKQEIHTGSGTSGGAPEDMHGSAAPAEESAGVESTDADEPAANTAEEFDEPWAQSPSEQASPVRVRPNIVQHPLAQQILGMQPTPPDRDVESEPARSTSKFSFEAAPSAPPASVEPPRGATPQPAQPASRATDDPAELFSSMMGAGPLLGVLLLDAQGLVMAGGLGDHTLGDADALGATLGPAISEAHRTVSLLTLGEWRGMLLEAGTAVLHVSPIRTGGGFVLLAAKRNAPTGWVLRSASQAAEIAAHYLQEHT